MDRENLKFFKENKIESLLLLGSLLIMFGILLSLGGWSKANLSILLGTLLLGLGFYIKGRNKSEPTLSDYGHFMLGLGTLIALPQTPEILNKITQIRDGVIALEKSNEKANSILAGLAPEILRNALSKANPMIDESLMRI